jgi:hypothetical protein
MSQATADVPAKEGTMPGNQKPAPVAQRATPSYLPAPIDEVNASIAAVWEQLGIFAKIKVQKESLLKLCNLQEMPLIGVDVIPTQQGLKLYVNGEGAKFNRERYLSQNGRRMIERVIDIVPYAEAPGSDPVRDKAQGRLYFRITTTCEDVDQKNKIVNAVASGIIKASEVTETLKALKIITTSITWSAYSNQSEKFSDNRQPDVILKKGITQSHRRADLELSSQVVIPEDEEPTDASFMVKSDELLEKATSAAMGAASLPAKTLVPDKAAKQPDAPTAPAAAAAPVKPGPGVGEQTPSVSEIDAIMTSINAIFEAAKLKKVDRIKWFTERGYPISKAQMTVDILKKALSEVTAQFAPPEATKAPAAAAPAQEAPKADQPKLEPEKAPQWKQDGLKKVFGLREKAGFADDETVRTWVKETFSKGLSEMDLGQMEAVVSRLAACANTLAQHQKCGFESTAQFACWIEEGSKKPVYNHSEVELTKILKDFEELTGT